MFLLFIKLCNKNKSKIFNFLLKNKLSFGKKLSISISSALTKKICWPWNSFLDRMKIAYWQNQPVTLFKISSNRYKALQNWFILYNHSKLLFYWTSSMNKNNNNTSKDKIWVKTSFDIYFLYKIVTSLDNFSFPFHEFDIKSDIKVRQILQKRTQFKPLNLQNKIIKQYLHVLLFLTLAQ